MNDWVLITGASTGIGAEFAKLFAQHRYNLVLTARDAGRLNALAQELKAKYSVEIKVIVKDLAVPQAAREIFDALTGTPISILVNNAGFGSFAPFAENALSPQTDMMQVNMTALVELTHLFLPAMIARCGGRILNVASIAAFQPGPFKTIYFASKAFVFSFSHGLANEVAEAGVTVTALCPGVTQTEFHQRAGGNTARKGYAIMTAADVAAIGFRGLMQGKRTVIPGFMNKVNALIVRLLPSRVAAAAVRQISGR